MERKQIKERQREGIELAKIRGVYKGRSHGSKEDIRNFLSKPKVVKTIEYLKKGYKASEISRIVDIHVNTITKVKKMVDIN
jgi:DNA invertase Pin-like site-specific DNA recombinase